MKNKVRVVLTILVVLSILGGSVWGMLIVQEKYKEGQKKKAGTRDLAVTVQIGKVGRDRIDEVLTFNGDVQAMQAVSIQPKISGRLQSLSLDGQALVEEGMTVSKGQTIAQIDDRELQAALANARAALAIAKADIASQEAGLLNARAAAEQQSASLNSAHASTASAQAAFADKERELLRQKTLFEKQAATQQVYDQAQTAFAQAEAELNRARASEQAVAAQVRAAEAAIQQSLANVERSKASVLQAEAALQLAEVNFSETKLYAPMDGVISAKHIDPGAMVSPTTPIVTLLSIEEVKVLLSVPVNHLSRLQPGRTRSRLRTISLPGEVIDCQVDKIYPAVSLDTRTAQVELRIPNRRDDYGNYKLKPGMYVTAEILIETREDVIAIDSALPIRNLERQLVYRVKNDNTVQAVDVKLGTRFGDRVEVLDGLQEGDQIVIVGQHRLTDGAAIKVLAGNRLEMREGK